MLLLFNLFDHLESLGIIFSKFLYKLPNHAMICLCCFYYCFYFFVYLLLLYPMCILYLYVLINGWIGRCKNIAEKFSHLGRGQQITDGETTNRRTDHRQTDGFATT